MSEPNTSEPLHSSCTRQVRVRLAVGDRRWIAEDVERDAADRRQEHRQIGPRHQFRIHAAGLLEQSVAQFVFADVEALGDAGQIPDRIDRGLGDRDIAAVAHDVAVDLRRPAASGEFRNGEPRLGNGDGRADIEAFGDLRARSPAATRWPHGSSETMRLRLAPLRERPDIDDRRGIGEIGPRDRIERAGRHRKRAVKRIGAAMRCRSRCGRPAA